MTTHYDKNNKASLPKIDINTLHLHKCPKCQNTSFISALELRVVPFIVSPTGRNELLQTPILVCTMCGGKVLEADVFGVKKEKEPKNVQ